MIITPAKLSIAPVKAEFQEKIGEFVKDAAHHLAATGEISKSLGLDLSNGIALNDKITLEPLPVKQKKYTPEQQLKLKKLAFKFAQGTLPQIKPYFSQQLTPVFEGADIILASDAAINSWIDSERKTVVDPLIKSARVFVEIYDVVKWLYPQLATNQYLNSIGTMVKIGDTAFQIYGEIKKVTSNESLIKKT